MLACCVRILQRGTYSPPLIKRCPLPRVPIRVTIRAGRTPWTRTTDCCFGNSQSLHGNSGRNSHARSTDSTGGRSESRATIRRRKPGGQYRTRLGRARALAYALFRPPRLATLTLREGQKGKRAKAYSVLARRKPRLPVAWPGWPVERYPPRQLLTLESQLQPRATRPWPAPGPRGSVTEPPG